MTANCQSQHNSSIESSTSMISPCLVSYPVTGMRFSFGFRHASAARRLALAPCTPAIPNEPNPKIGHSEAGGRGATLRIRATPRNSRFAFPSLAWESSTRVRPKENRVSERGAPSFRIHNNSTFFRIDTKGLNPIRTNQPSPSMLLWNRVESRARSGAERPAGRDRLVDRIPITGIHVLFTSRDGP